MSKVTGFRLKEVHQEKLNHLATALGISPNAVITKLIENAQIIQVARFEPTSTICAEGQRNGQVPNVTS